MLTVLFATRDRAALVTDVLEAYTRLRTPAGGWKLVVVDNGSEDGTRDRLAAFADRLPLTYVREDRPGKNLALTTGLESAAGDLIVLTDDDAFPEADWLVRLRAAADAQPSYAIFGGVVRPRWEAPPPDWVQRLVPHGPVFSLTPPNTPAGPTGSDMVFGPNMAVRAAVFEVGHGFDTTIGPRGSQYAMGSETELVRRLVRHGYAAWHVDDAVVGHFIRKSQMRPRWIFDRAVRFGRGQYRMEPAHAVAQIFGVPRYLLREMAASSLAMLRSVLRGSGAALFDARWRFNFAYGQALESLQMSRAARAPGPEVHAPSTVPKQEVNGP